MTHPESDVLSAIDALERDEIGELVTWQIEQGRKREPARINLEPPTHFEYTPTCATVRVTIDAEEFRRRVGEFTRRCDGCDSPDPHDFHLTDAGRQWLGLDPVS